MVGRTKVLVWSLLYFRSTLGKRFSTFSCSGKFLSRIENNPKKTSAWLVFWYLLEHGAFTRLQIALLALSNYIVYASEPPSVWDNILVRFMFRGKLPPSNVYPLFLETEKVPVTGYILLLHLFQRFYESFFVQRSVSKMSIIHYGVGITFYFLLPLQFVSSEISEDFSHTVLEYISLIGMIISIFGQHKW